MSSGKLLLKTFMDLHILPRKEAIVFVPSKPTYAIRIFSSFHTELDRQLLLRPSPNYRRIMEYIFDDNDIGGRSGPIDLTPQMALELVRDFAQHRDTVQALLVHCTLGKNRAPAVGIALNKIFALGKKHEELEKRFAEYNRLVYREILYAGKKL